MHQVYYCLFFRWFQTRTGGAEEAVPEGEVESEVHALLLMMLGVEGAGAQR